MTTMTLPLESLVLSICVKGEDRPLPPDGLGTALYMDFKRLSAATLRQIAPDETVSWLFCEEYDVHDVATLLTAAEFRGRYTALAPRLPAARAVTREIRSHFPELDFRLCCPAELSERAATYHSRISAPSATAALAPA